MRQTMEQAGGVLEGKKMGTTFNMLRANDLIWSFVVEQLPAGQGARAVRFALLEFRHDAHARSDASVLSREFYKNNALSQGKMSFDNVKLDLSKVKISDLSAEREGDHIAPFRSSTNRRACSADRSASSSRGLGHIAGVIIRQLRRSISSGTNDKIGGEKGKPYPATVEEWQVRHNRAPAPGGRLGFVAVEASGKKGCRP